MALTILKSLITSNITQNGSGDTITASEEREVLNLIADTMQKSATFSATIPFDALITIMTETTMSGLITLIPNSLRAIPGAKTICRFVGNGNITHVLDLSNFCLSIGAASTNITTATGIVTEVTLTYDGVDFCADLKQLYTPVYPLATTSAASVSNTFKNKVLLTTSQPFTTFSGLANGNEFTVTGHAVAGVTGGAGVGNNQLVVLLSTPFAASENSTISYSPVRPAYSDVAGVFIAPFTNLAIADNVVAVVALPTFVTSITVEPGAPNTVVLTYSKNVYQFNANFKTSWLINGVQPSSGSIIYATVVNLVMASNFAHGDVITIDCVNSTYDGFADGTNLNAFTNAPVTNNL